MELAAGDSRLAARYFQPLPPAKQTSRLETFLSWAECRRRWPANYRACHRLAINERPGSMGPNKVGLAIGAEPSGGWI